MSKTCLYCSKPVKAHGLCNTHYQRWYRGDPLLLARRQVDDPLARYEAKVDRSAGPTACHPWTGYCDPDGYGRFGGSSAHRWGYQAFIGPVDPGQVVRHTCDNPPCQNRAHWLLGTDKDNVADKVSRQRQSRREHHGMALLTEGDVAAIRRAHEAGDASYRALAGQYGVSKATVAAIVKRRSWH
jgi:hypothetical protein